jgi:nitroreductase
MLCYAAMSVWTSLLQNAIHSPSPHNVQPWRVRILSDNEADLLIDSQRTLPKEDPTGSFIILTMGMFIEALRLLASNQGLRLEHSMYHEPAWYAVEILKTREHTFFPFARMSLARDESVLSTFDPTLLLKRRTARITLQPDLLPDSTVQQFKALAHQWEQRYEQTTDPLLIERILAKNTEALFADLNNPHYHDEIVEWFRFTDAAAQATRDGLDYRCMNTSRSAYWLSARVPKLLELPVARTILARKYRSQLGLVPTIGMLAGEFWKPASAFKTGSFLMQFWLATAVHNLYIHPYGNLVTNNAASAWLRQETGIENIWLIFKIGYSGEPPKSYRRSVEEILLA